MCLATFMPINADVSIVEMSDSMPEVYQIPVPAPEFSSCILSNMVRGTS